MNAMNLDRESVRTPGTQRGCVWAVWAKSQLLFWFDCLHNKNIKTLRIYPHCLAVSLAFVHIFCLSSWCSLKMERNWNRWSQIWFYMFTDFRNIYPIKRNQIQKGCFLEKKCQEAHSDVRNTSITILWYVHICRNQGYIWKGTEQDKLFGNSPFLPN